MGITSWVMSGLGMGETAATVAESQVGKVSTTSAMDAAVNTAGGGAATASPDWWTKGLSSALPQIMQVSARKAGSRAPMSSSSAKPVSGNASSAMQVPQMIGREAGKSPLDNLNQWSNLF